MTASTPADLVIERLLDRAVARALADSPRATALLEGLRGRRLAIRVSGTPWRVLIESTGRTLKRVPFAPAAPAAAPTDTPTDTPTGTPTAAPADAPTAAPADAPTAALADATLIGAPLSLLALSGPDAQAVLQRGDARIEGNLDVAQQFRELALHLRPDMEAGLAGLLGRSGAHVAMRGLRAAVGWSRAAAWTSVRNVAEYLAHESGDLVSRPEAEHFLRGVEQLREQLDRIEARLQILETRRS
jgi:ubiquinone biosynthesis protein UbiJ